MSTVNLHGHPGDTMIDVRNRLFSISALIDSATACNELIGDAAREEATALLKDAQVRVRELARGAGIAGDRVGEIVLGRGGSNA